MKTQQISVRFPNKFVLDSVNNASPVLKPVDHDFFVQRECRLEVNYGLSPFREGGFLKASADNAAQVVKKFLEVLSI